MQSLAGHRLALVYYLSPRMRARCLCVFWLMHFNYGNVPMIDFIMNYELV